MERFTLYYSHVSLASAGLPPGKGLGYGRHVAAVRRFPARRGVRPALRGREQLPRMSAILVDTDVVGLLFSNAPECEPYAGEILGQLPLVSFQTVAEVERWTVKRAWTPERCAWMHLYLERYTVVPSSPDLCRRWAEVLAAGDEMGHPVPYGSAWIAATALLYRVPLLTHNPERYRGIPALEAVSFAGQSAGDGA